MTEMNLRELKIGSRGDKVRLWQLFLTNAGFDPGPVDGIFGDNTADSTTAFQRTHGLDVDGIVGPNTYEKAMELGFPPDMSAGGCAPGEADRVSRIDLELSVAGELWIPFARRNVEMPMRTRGRYRRGYPEGAIVHFTAGRDNPLSDICSACSNGYAYLVIAPNGVVYQNFPLNEWGCHAGSSYWPELGSGVSQYLVGIELCCAGKLRRLDENHFRPWYNEAEYLEECCGRQPDPTDDFPRHLVRHVGNTQNQQRGWYEKYTDAQEQSLREVLIWLKRNNPEVFSFDYVLGHDEVAPTRKNDPGGALSMTMPALRERLRANV